MSLPGNLWTVAQSLRGVLEDEAEQCCATLYRACVSMSYREPLQDFKLGIKKFPIVFGDRLKGDSMKARRPRENFE